MRDQPHREENFNGQANENLHCSFLQSISLASRFVLSSVGKYELVSRSGNSRSLRLIFKYTCHARSADFNRWESTWCANTGATFKNGLLFCSARHHLGKYHYILDPAVRIEDGNSSNRFPKILENRPNVIHGQVEEHNRNRGAFLISTEHSGGRSFCRMMSLCHTINNRKGDIIAKQRKGECTDRGTDLSCGSSCKLSRGSSSHCHILPQERDRERQRETERQRERERERERESQNLLSS